MAATALKGQLAEDAEVLADGVTAVLHTGVPADCAQQRVRDIPWATDSADPNVNLLPSPPHLQGPAPAGLFEAVAKVAIALGYTVGLSDVPGGNPTTSGMVLHRDRLIQVNRNRSPLHRVKTACHEAAHMVLHRPGTPLHARNLPRRVHELQAETTAWMVLRRLGIDSSPFSFAYIAKYGYVRIGAELFVRDAVEQTVAEVAGPVRYIAAGVSAGALV